MSCGSRWVRYKQDTLLPTNALNSYQHVPLHIGNSKHRSLLRNDVSNTATALI